MGESNDIWGRLKTRHQDGSSAEHTDPAIKRASHNQTPVGMTTQQKSREGRGYTKKRISKQGVRNTAISRVDVARKKVSNLRGTIHSLGYKKIVIGTVSVVMLTGVVAGVYQFFSAQGVDNGDTPPQSLGVSGQDERQNEGGLPVVTPSFDVLLPVGTSEDDFRIVLVSPEGNAPAYTFVDEITGAPVQVTQQEVSKIPSYRGADLIAADFQATSALQVNDVTVYYGVNERSGAQSVIAEKEGILLLIVASREIPDEVLAGYISSLQTR